MTIRLLADLIGATPLTGESTLHREVQSGYACDLLSWVMAHGARDMAWITVQTHMNVVAVAVLMEMSCVIVPERISVPAEVIARADSEGVAVLSAEQTAFELAGKMYAAGLKGA